MDELELLEDVPEYMIDDLRNHGYSDGKLAKMVSEYGDAECVRELWTTLCTDPGDRVRARNAMRIA